MLDRVTETSERASLPTTLPATRATNRPEIRLVVAIAPVSTSGLTVWVGMSTTASTGLKGRPVGPAKRVAGDRWVTSSYRRAFIGTQHQPFTGKERLKNRNRVMWGLNRRTPRIGARFKCESPTLNPLFLSLQIRFASW